MADQGDMQMKKMLVVNNHMAVGGVQKSLIGFLKDMQKEYDVSLLLLYPSGPLMQMIPAGVHVLGTASLFRYFGMSQSDCRRVSDRAIRASLVLLARFLGTDAVVRLAAKGMDSFGVFDEIVSFHHPGRDKTIYGGTADYALCYAKRHGGKTSCYVHCDYSHSGLNDPRSKRLYRRFDQIVCVSEGTRGSFLQAFAEDKDTIRDEIAAKTVIRYNSLDAESIQKKAEEGGVPACWAEQTCLKLLSVARLSKEKGILRMVKLFAGMNLPPYRYVILGDGEEKQAILQAAREQGLEGNIFLEGEVLNPYPYMKHADWLLVPSYHEAAPVVFQEAEVMKLPILATETLSAREMVWQGLVVPNTDEGLRAGLEEVSSKWKA